MCAGRDGRDGAALDASDQRDAEVDAMLRAYSPEAGRRLREKRLDVEAIAGRGLRYERLDQMMMEHLMGVRG